MTLFKFGSRVELERSRVVVLAGPTGEIFRIEHAFRERLFLEFSACAQGPPVHDMCAIWKPAANEIALT
jgi:hypothetical protein